jgi:hypothetical protein
MAQEKKGKQIYCGVICPKLLDKYTYLDVPRTEEQCYELTWADFREMSDKLNGKPLCAMHGSVPVGKIVSNWATGTGQWQVKFEVDTDSLAGYDMSQQVAAGTLNALSLKHHHGDKEPYEVSLVFEPARDGSVILRDGSKNTESYKAANGAPVQGWSRETVIQAAKGSMTHIRLHNEQDDKTKKSDFTVVSAGGGSLAALETAEALIAREQQMAANAAKQAEDARQAIEVAKRREMNAQQHKQLDAARKDAAPMQTEGLAMPAQIPSAGEQMRTQVESQIKGQQQPPNDPMTLAMDQEEDVAAAPKQAPQRITGDPDVDAILNDPSVSQQVKERLIVSMEKRRAEETKLRKDAEAARAAHEQEKAQFRENYIKTNVAFQQMMLGKLDPKAADDLAQRARSGALDEHIMSPAGKMEVAAQKRAVKLARQNQTTSQSLSQELLNRARALDQSLGGGTPPGVAHSFSSSSYGDTRVVTAGLRGPPVQVDEEEDDDDDTMGLGMPKEFKKPGVVAAGKQQKQSFGHASGSSYGGSIYAPWNTRLEDAWRRQAIGEMTARKLVAPDKLHPSHPVVVSAAKGGLGAELKDTVHDEKGAGSGWAPGLTKEYFHPDTLAALIGDGSEVPDEFTLPPEDPEHARGQDLGGVVKGATSSRKRFKMSD